MASDSPGPALRPMGSHAFSMTFSRIMIKRRIFGTEPLGCPVSGCLCDSAIPEHLSFYLSLIIIIIIIEDYLTEKL